MSDPWSGLGCRLGWSPEPAARVRVEINNRSSTGGTLPVGQQCREWERCPGNRMCFRPVSRGQNPLQVIKPPLPPASPTAAGVRPRISSPACARSGDGTHYRWEMTLGSQGPGLASAAGKSALICPFNKTQGVCAPPPGKRAWKGAPSGQGRQATRQRGFRGHQSPGGELGSDDLASTSRNFSAFGNAFQRPHAGVYQARSCPRPCRSRVLEVWKEP